MRAFFGVVVSAALVACTQEGPLASAPPAPATDAAVVAQNDIGGLMNAERAGRGLAPLVRDARLVAAAEAHALDMARTGRFSHTGSGGSEVSDRVQAQGYGYCYVAENIAQGQASAGEAMASWINSSGHRRNNLSQQARDYGAARGAGDYWVLVFGRDGC